MRILITAPDLDPTVNVSGISTVVNSIISNSNHDFHHYKLGQADDTSRKFKKILNTLFQISNFPHAILCSKFDIVHLNVPFNTKGIIREFIITIIAKATGHHVIHHIHGGQWLMSGCPNILMRFIAALMLKLSSCTIVLSHLEEISLKSNFNVETIYVLSNAVTANPTNTKKSSLQNRKFTLLFMGRIHESKGIDDIIEAIRILYPNIRFKFIACGSGPLTEKLKLECTKIMGDDFKYLGKVVGNEKMNIIRESDIFILPSRWGEGLPMALLETMAEGVVPITTDDASMKEVVVPMVTGMRVRKYDPIDIAEKLKALASDNNLYESLSTNAAIKIRNCHSIEQYINQLHTIYANTQ